MTRENHNSPGNAAAAGNPGRMHSVSPETTQLVDLVLDYSRRRMLDSATPLDKPESEAALDRLAAGALTEGGIGA